MKTWKKILIVLVLVAIVFAFGIVAYIFTGNGPNLYHIDPQEKIAIQAVRYNATQNSITIYTNAVNDEAKNATFLYALIKDQNGNTVMNIPISDKLNELELTTITIKLNSTLPSGRYTVTLNTAKGGSFVSPSFTLP